MGEDELRGLQRPVLGRRGCSSRERGAAPEEGLLTGFNGSLMLGQSVEGAARSLKGQGKEGLQEGGRPCVRVVSGSIRTKTTGIDRWV